MTDYNNMSRNRASGNPYHQGERRIQQLANVVSEADQVASLISNQLSDNAIRFIEQQSTAVIGSVDLQGNIWSSVVISKPGFIRAINAFTVEIKAKNLKLNEGQSIAVIIINYATRQRFRLNGYVQLLKNRDYQITIKQAYSNCPRYIRQHEFYVRDNFITKSSLLTFKHGELLNLQQQQLIKYSDTFFVASANKTNDIDVSHKGGQPGFVHLVSNQQIRIPDYPGNNMFNTLGNFEVHPYAGISFIDFKNNIILNMTGDVEILWNHEYALGETQGSKRYWLFNIKHWTQTSCTEL